MTKILLALLISFITTSISNKDAFANIKDDTPIIRVGDVILIDINCYLCKVIRSETNSAYSHSGLVVGEKNGEFLIAQSLGTTEVVTGTEFLSLKRQKSSVKVIRSTELNNLFKYNKKEFASRIRLMQYIYFNKYEGTKFDRDFLWNNSKDGKELLYCAEMIVKLLNEVLNSKVVPGPMSFKKNWDYWLEYYKESFPPEGLPGVSPATFETDPHFETVAILK